MRNEGNRNAAYEPWHASPSSEYGSDDLTTYLRRGTKISGFCEIEKMRMKRTGKVDVARAKSDKIVSGSDRIGGNVG